MVKNAWLLTMLLCLTCSGMAAAEVRLTIKADKKTLVLGEPLQVELMAEEGGEPLSGINLDMLKQNFNVYGVSSNIQTQIHKGRTVTKEIMTLTLYPLRIGKLQLPALRYRGKSTQPMLVTVLESSKQTSRVIIKTSIDSTHQQVRQADTVTLDIYDDGSLQWSTPRELVAATVHQRPLAASQREEMVDGKRYTVHRYAWALMPLREGGVTVQFPMLDAMKFGTRLRYAVSPLWINAAPVPSYLPVHVPIGQIQFVMEPMPAEIALDRPVNWIFTVKGSGVSIEGMGKLLSGMHGNGALSFYPPVIIVADNEHPTSAMQTMRITLPFVPLRTGALQLPEINIPYYDPASSRVESVVIPRVSVAVFNPLWQTVQKFVLGLMVLLGIGAFGYVLLKQLRRSLKKRKSLLTIRRAASADELQQALLKFDVDTLSMHSLTLQQWLQRMQMTYVVDERLLMLVQKLEYEKYGVDQIAMNTSQVAQEAAMLLKRLSFRKK